MRKIILTGAVLAMLTSAAPMVHAQVDPGVQAKKDYDAKIQKLEGDIKKLQDAIGKDHKEGLRKDIYDVKTDNKIHKDVIKYNREALEGADGKGGLKKDVGGLKKDIAELGGRIDVTGAMSAALAGLKPLQYDPMAPTQVMGSVSTYEGQQAYALGLAHFTSEDLMVHGGVSFTNSHKYMANVGVTYKFGHSAEKSMIPMRYQAGPISSIYVMQKENEMMREKMAQQEERIAQLEEMIMNMKK